MNTLTFDTSTNACSVALQTGNRIFSRFEIAPRMHATILLPMIQSILDESHCTLEKINVIGFAAGPGSFMGVRLATATAQGLAYGLQIPVVPVSTLQLLAQTALLKNQLTHVAAGWDARMHEIYWNEFEVNAQGIMQPKQEDVVCSPDCVDTASLHRLGSKLVGNAWSQFQNTQHLEIYPEACAMLPIVNTAFLNNRSIAAFSAEPHYVRHHVVHNHNHQS